jgi:hypothetical protein
MEISFQPVKISPKRNASLAELSFDQIITRFKEMISLSPMSLSPKLKLTFLFNHLIPYWN